MHKKDRGALGTAVHILPAQGAGIRRLRPPSWAAGFTRQDATGEPFGGWQAQERLTREQAWKAYTVDAAWAGFAENKFGRLAPGLAADFIVIDKGDPLLLSPGELRNVSVQETWVGGEKVFERKGGRGSGVGR